MKRTDAERVRTLPMVVPPLTEPAESFVGYADRLSAFLEIPLKTLLRRTGVMEEGMEAVPGGYGVFLSPAALAQFARATRLPEETVAGMLLTRYDGVCADFSGIDVSDARSLRKPSQRFWAYSAGTHACPACLAGGQDENTPAVWKLSWKVPWSFACVEHRILLLDRCPACDTRLRTGNAFSRGKLPFQSRVLDPGMCANQLPRKIREQGQNGPCGHPLSEVVTPSLSSWPELLATQEHLQRLLDGSVEQTAVAGEAVPALEYFGTLRALSALLLAYCTVEDLGDAPAFSLEFFEHIRGAYLEGRRSKLTHAFNMPPEDTSILCAVVPAATRMAGVGSVAMLSEILEPLLRRLRADGASSATVLRLLSASSAPLTGAFERVYAGRTSHTVALLRQSADRISASVHRARLSPDHVPQLLDEETYSELFADLFPYRSRYYARRVCAMSIVRLTGPPSWSKAAELLELPPERSRQIANELLGTLRRSSIGEFETFAERIDEVARRIIDTPEDERIDYRQRRRSLEHLEVVPYSEWKRICAKVGIGPGKDGVRNRCAAAWIWCRVAGGDRWLSPAIRGSDSNTIRVHYQRFEQECTGELARLLKDYGFSLLPADAALSENRSHGQDHE